MSYNEIANKIKEEFNYPVTRQDVELYFEPNASEEGLDLMLQMKNLGL